VLDNIGASGNPCAGATLILINILNVLKKLWQAMRIAIAHDRQIKGAIDGQVGGATDRLAVRCRFTSVGATGTGVVHIFTRREFMSYLSKVGGRPKIILEGLLRGSLSTHDDLKADTNERTLMRYLRATATGHHVDSFTGQVREFSPDLLLLSSNQNCNGSILTLDQLRVHNGHWDFAFWHTRAGAKLRERLSDIQSWEYDQYGDPLVASTNSCSFLGRDSNRVIKTCNYRTSALFAQALLSEGDSENVKDEAAGLARLYRLVESDEDNQVSAPLLYPDALQGETLSERAKRSFKDRLGNTKGIHRAIAISEALNAIRSSDISSVYEPMMSNQARAKLDSKKQAFAEALSQRMRSLKGIWECFMLLTYLKVIVENSQQVLLGKLNNLQELLNPHEEILTEGFEQLNQLQEQGRVGRALNHMLISRICSNIEESGQSAIEYQLQMSACAIAIQDFLQPLIEHLDHKIAWLSASFEKFRSLHRTFCQKADTLASKSTLMHVPLGYEMTTCEYLEDYFNDYVDQAGGEHQLATDILNRFIMRYDSIAILLETPTDEVADIFESMCNEIFEPLVKSKNVVDEFRRLYPDAGSQQRLFEELVRQSEGRLRITGEVNKQVPWLKVAGVPAPEHIDWVRQLLEKVDKKPGKWEVAVHAHDPDRITVMQLRGGISLTPFIERLEPPDKPEGWAKVIEVAPDPASAIGVGPNPTQRQFKRVLAKAIVTGLLSIDENGFFHMKCPHGEPIAIGNDFASVERKLQPQWPLLVFIESTFFRDLVVDDKKISSDLKQIYARLLSGDIASDSRLGLIDLAAIEEAMTQAELLTPRARRFRKANIQRWFQ
jgi:hypothetical protein